MNLESQQLIAAFPDIKTLLEGSHVHHDNLEELLKHWIANRKPIVNAIDGDGTFLDIGCANGFLLACLIRWSKHQITPYGIDVDENSIQAARDLLPEYASHFAELSLESLDECSKFGLPTLFDVVYWNVWDNFDLRKPNSEVYAKNVFGAARAGGRVILGFYNTDLEVVQKQLEWMVSKFGAFTEKLESGVVFAWWDCKG
jgi:SAM-dependent methyltransferase